jgi:hypothetical protein
MYDIVDQAYTAACNDPDVSCLDDSDSYEVEVRAAGLTRSIDLLISNLPPNSHKDLIEVTIKNIVSGQKKYQNEQNDQDDQDQIRKSTSKGSSRVSRVSIMPTNQQQQQHKNSFFTLGKLSSLGYTTSPSAKELETWTLDQLSSVIDFSVKKEPDEEGYGWVCVTWPGSTNLTNLDLSTILRIEGQEIFLYREEDVDDTDDYIMTREITTHRPPIGHGLNKPFHVQMSNVLRDMPPTFPISSIEKMLKERLEQVLQFATFEKLESRREGGILSFRVEHL